MQRTSAYETSDDERLHECTLKLPRVAEVLAVAGGGVRFVSRAECPEKHCTSDWEERSASRAITMRSLDRAERAACQQPTLSTWITLLTPLGTAQHEGEQADHQQTRDVAPEAQIRHG